MKPISEVMIGIAALAIVIGVGVYVTQHVTCWHIPYLVNGCVVTK